MFCNSLFTSKLSKLFSIDFIFFKIIYSIIIIYKENYVRTICNYKTCIKIRKIVKKFINVQDKDNYNAHPQQNLPVLRKYINGNALEYLNGELYLSGQKIKILNL